MGEAFLVERFVQSRALMSRLLAISVVTFVLGACHTESPRDAHETGAVATGAHVGSVQVHPVSATPTDLVWEAGPMIGSTAPCASLAVEAWTGTATREESSFGTDDITVTVTWRHVDTTGCVDSYEPVGTAGYFYGIPGALCEQMIEPDTVSIDPGDGVLTIDRTMAPPTYRATGETSWPGTWVCTFPDNSVETLMVDAGGVWLDASGTVAGGVIEGAFRAERPDCHLNEREQCDYGWGFAALGP